MYTIIFYFSLLRFLFASNFCDSQVSSLFYVNISPGVYHHYHQSSHQNVQVSFFLGPFYFQCSSDLSWKSRIVSGLMFSFFRPLLETENSFRTNFFILSLFHISLSLFIFLIFIFFSFSYPAMVPDPFVPGMIPNPELTDFPVFVPNFQNLIGAVLGVPLPGDPYRFFQKWTRSARKVWLHRRYIHLNINDFHSGQIGMKNLFDALFECLCVALKEEFFVFMCFLFDCGISVPAGSAPPWAHRALPAGMTYMEMRMLAHLSESFSASSAAPSLYVIDTIHRICSEAVISLDPADPSNV